MSMPYGQLPAAPQPGPTSPSDGGLDLAKILAIATGGLGLVIYFLSFTDDVGGYLRGLTGVLLVGGGLLAAAALLPKAPVTLVPAAVAVVTGTLFLLIDITAGPSFLGGVSSDVPGLAILALILAFLESGAVVLALLMSAGLVNLPPRPRPRPQQSWEHQQSGGYPGQAASGGYPGPPAPGGYPGQGVYPTYGGYPDQGTSSTQGGPTQVGYPGQYQPPGPPASGYPVPPPQSYQPHTVQYQSLPDQYGQPQYGGQPGQDQYGGEPHGQYSGDEPGQGSGERTQPERPHEPGERPGTPPGSPGQG
ncbi:MAG: DUF5336 domain-containing protein [Pseudonocardiaceae bacterium]